MSDPYTQLVNRLRAAREVGRFFYFIGEVQKTIVLPVWLQMNLEDGEETEITANVKHPIGLVWQKAVRREVRQKRI